jgi:hypothetical protein
MPAFLPFRCGLSFSLTFGEFQLKPILFEAGKSFYEHVLLLAGRHNLHLNRVLIFSAKKRLADLTLDVSCLSIRVARWHTFKPKIPICVNFLGSGSGRGWYIIWPFGYFTAIRYIFVAIW